MAVASSSDYAKGSLLASDQDWYHGQLTRAEAEQALTASGKDCFLIRESKGALVLSLLYNQRSCHIKIKYGPGSYKLDLDSVSKSFAEVNGLLSYYRSHFVSDKLKVMLGEVCKKDAKVDMSYPDSKVYAKACPSISGKAWYHGELTRIEAEHALAISGNDCFLIRECEKSLVLSVIHHGQVHHIYGPGWYKLESGLAPSFTELDTLVSYYRDNTVSHDINITLGMTCKTKAIKEISHSLYHQTTINDAYSKGEPENLSKHVWYHGNVTKEQAIQELLSMKMDGFLVHQADDDLILSINVRQVIFHKKIHRNPEGYRLEGKEMLFSNIPEMIAHYKQFPIDDKMLGAECKRESDVNYTHRYETISADPVKYKWYHENITEDQAHIILRKYKGNCFLVCSSGGDLILSSQRFGYIYHDIIHKSRSSRGYCLEGREAYFESIPDLVAHYRKFPINYSQLIGNPCDREQSEVILRRYYTDQKVKATFKQESSMLTLKWRKCAGLPSQISVPAAVKIGKHVYVGGGMRKGREIGKIFKYALDEDAWSLLPYCTTNQHSLATLDDELIVIGGIMSKIEGTVLTLREDKWIEELPSMPTPRCSHSSATHKNRVIIVAGGVTSSKEDTGTETSTDAIEIYIKDNQWFNTKRLPFPLAAFSLNIINDTCYILGGNGTPEQSYTTVYTTVSSLLENAEPADSQYSMPQCPATWDQLKGKHPLVYTTTTQINGKLFAMGGSAAITIRHGTRFISNYDFATDTWVECKGAELPVPLYRTTVLNLDNDEVICIGGQPKSQQFSAEVYIGSLKCK